LIFGNLLVFWQAFNIFNGEKWQIFVEFLFFVLP